MTTPTDSDREAHRKVRELYDDAGSARAYSTKFSGTDKSQREQACIARAFADVPRGSKVLHLPCGAGRMTTFLVGLGFDVTAADLSADMVRLAREKCVAEFGEEETAARLNFAVMDILDIPLPDDTFDAVLCNRLLHHYPTAALRRGALSELARVTRGPVVASFFSNFALDSLKFHVLKAVSGRNKGHRFPCSTRTFLSDVDAAGLEVSVVEPVRFVVSPQTYVKAYPSAS